MSAYLVIEITTDDTDRFKQYESGALSLAARFGGEPMARDVDPMLIERTDKPTLGVLMRFADKQAVRDYFNSPDYAPLRTFRQSFSQASALVIET